MIHYKTSRIITKARGINQFSSSLAVCELGFLLLDERCHPNSAVIGCEGRVEETLLKTCTYQGGWREEGSVSDGGEERGA